jgi:hypothetical protein
MAIAKLHEHPSLSNPQVKKQRLADALHRVDEDVTLLYCVMDTVRGLEEAPGDDVVKSLECLHGRLRRNVNELFALT